MDERQGPADESASGGGTGGSSGSSGGPADESAPKGVPPQSPPARAGIEPPWTEGLDSAHSGATLGVVLAGGLSRRMGDLGAKAALAIGGEHLLARVARRLRAAGLRDVLVVGPSELGALVPGVPVVAD
ncbi:MAG TPA: NTP transferase domain-containing protein, partial [Ktedonobacterales bacterium]|nr:NTP transferase domain-containing protein [Ktedonobacterales bacterium]